MKVEKFKVLLYLKRSGLDKSGKAPIMGRITVNRTIAQFSSKLSCTPELWNPRESRLNGKSKEAVEINAKIDKLLLAINSAFDSLLERKQEFDATDVKNAFQGSKDIDHSKIKAKSPQTNGICERFNRTVQNEFYAIAFRKKIYTTIEQLQTDLDAWMNSYNTERTHSGKYCFGKTPMQTFIEGGHCRKEISTPKSGNNKTE